MIRVVALLLLLALLTACGPRYVTKPQVIKIKPPLALIAETPEPELIGDTWGDVAQYALQLKTGLATCNADKRALIEWAASSD